MTMTVIDRSFLDTTPRDSKLGAVRSFMRNLIALAIRVNFEVKRLTVTKEQAARYIYKLDSVTDSNE